MTRRWSRRPGSLLTLCWRTIEYAPIATDEGPCAAGPDQPERGTVGPPLMSTHGGERRSMRSTKREREAIRAYVEDQAHEEVVHLEKAASELVGPVRHDIWDVHCPGSRWWVVTEPTNLYSQEDLRLATWR